MEAIIAILMISAFALGVISGAARKDKDIPKGLNPSLTRACIVVVNALFIVGTIYLWLS